MNDFEKKTFQPVKVYVRQRPFTKHEIELKCPNVIHKITFREIIIKSGYTEKKYNFNHVFDENQSQAEVYNVVVRPLINHIVCGYNCTVFAYGQTGSGKTHTITGKYNNIDFNDETSNGLIPRAATQLFSELLRLPPKTEYTVRISFIEIYNEEVRDLLGDCTSLRIYDVPESKGSVSIKGLTEITVRNAREVYDWFNVGMSSRQTATTNLNVNSSRSHILFTLLVTTREITPGGDEIIKSGKLNLVDLAGSENIGKSGATDARAREAGTINKSLLTLGKVIKALAQKMQHIPYRDSKLTRILQDSLGGNAKTCMIATISPTSNSWDETVSTLDYAQLTRSVLNTPHLNINRKQADFVKELEVEINKLQMELDAARRGEGFYVSQEHYEKMSQVQDENDEKIMELIQQIQDIETYRNTKEEEYRELNVSFLETKTYLEAIEKELDDKTNKMKENEYVLEYMQGYDKELTSMTKKLLDICDVSTKHEEIYHHKYKNQCDSTLSNADIANEIIVKSRNCLKQTENATEDFVNNQNAHLYDIKENTNLLRENQMKNVEQLAQLVTDMKSYAETSNLSWEQLLNSETTDYMQNILHCFCHVYEELESQLKGDVKVKELIETCKKQLLARRTELQSKFQSYFDLVNDTITHKIEDNGKVKNITDKIMGDIIRRQNQNEKRVVNIKKRKLNFDENSKLLDEELSDITMESQELDKIYQEIVSSEKCENDGLIEKLRQDLVDYINCQREAVKEQILFLDKIKNDLDEYGDGIQKNMAPEKDKIHQYISDFIKTIENNLVKYNSELKSKVRVWIDKASDVKENVLKTIAENGEAIAKDVEFISNTEAFYDCDTKNVIVQSIEQLKDLEKSIIYTAHAGDTPVRVNHKLPNRIVSKIPNDIGTLLQQVDEESDS